MWDMNEPSVGVISNTPLYSTHHTNNSPSLIETYVLWNKWTKKWIHLLESFFFTGIQIIAHY